MTSILDRLKAGEKFAGDGAWGTMLFQRGLKKGDCPELMNLTNPEVVQEVALLYQQAGAQIVETNTFGGSLQKLADYNLGAKIEEINSTAVTLLRDKLGDSVYISGSCGPSGKILQPYGDAEPRDLAVGFEMQMSALINAGADLICIETMTDLEEARIAIKAAKSISPEIPVIATMTFDKIPRGFFTVMGTGIEDAVLGLTEAGADIIGSNCGNGIDNMVLIAQEMKKLTELPILIQSNAGIPEIIDGELVYRETPDYFAEKTQELIRVGVSIIGGCCGSTPEHIKAIRKVLDAQKI